MLNGMLCNGGPQQQQQLWSTDLSQFSLNDNSNKNICPLTSVANRRVANNNNNMASGVGVMFPQVCQTDNAMPLTTHNPFAPHFGMLLPNAGDAVIDTVQNQLVDRFVSVLEDFKRLNHNVNVEKQTLEQQGMTLQTQARMMRDNIFKLQHEIETYRAQNGQLFEQLENEKRSALGEQQRLRAEIDRLTSVVEINRTGISSLEDECNERKRQVAELDKTFHDLESKFKALETEKRALEVALERERMRTEREVEKQKRDLHKELEILALNHDTLVNERDQKIHMLSSECERFGRDRHEVENRLNAYKTELGELGARYENSRVENDESRRRIEKLRSENADLAEQKKASQLFIMEIEQQFDDYKRAQQKRINEVENEFRVRAEQKMQDFNDMLQQRDALSTEVKDCYAKIKQLDKERNGLRECQKQLAAEVDKYAERERALREAKAAVEDSLDEARERLREREEELRAARRHHKEQLDELTEQKQREYHTVREELAKQEERLRESQARCEELRTLVEEWRAKAQKIEAEHRLAADEFEIGRQQLAEHKSLLKTKQTESATLNEQLDKMKKNNQTFNNDIIALKDHCDMLREEKNELMREMEELHLKLAESTHVNQALQAELNTHAQALMQVRSEYDKYIQDVQASRRISTSVGGTDGGGGDASTNFLQQQQADALASADRIARARRRADDVEQRASSPSRRTAVGGGTAQKSAIKTPTQYFDRNSSLPQRHIIHNGLSRTRAAKPQRYSNNKHEYDKTQSDRQQRHSSVESRRAASTTDQYNYFLDAFGKTSTKRVHGEHASDAGVADIRRKRDTEALIAAINSRELSVATN